MLGVPRPLAGSVSLRARPFGLVAGPPRWPLAGVGRQSRYGGTAPVHLTQRQRKSILSTSTSHANPYLPQMSQDIISRFQTFQLFFSVPPQN